MPVPQADQVSLEECIFKTVLDIFHLGKGLIVIYTLPEQYFSKRIHKNCGHDDK